MLKPVSIQKFMLACLGDCPAGNQSLQSSMFYTGRYQQ
jgi:hypothetical protein